MNSTAQNDDYWGKLKALPEFAVRRASAVDLKSPIFPWFCEIHGETEFISDTGACRHCSTPSEQRENLRAIARQQGSLTFPGACTTHGQTDFSVNAGRCLKCFTHNGSVRRRAAVAVTPERILEMRQMLIALGFSEGEINAAMR